VSPRASIRLGLRAKLTLVSLVWVFVPLVVVWSIGLYEDLTRRRTARAVRDAADSLALELGRQGLLTGGTADRRRLHDLARARHVMVRLINLEGAVLARTEPLDAERWSSIQRGWFRRAGDYFFGPVGPPDLLAHEASLPPEGRRPEVREALEGRPAETWRFASDGSMDIFYRALPLGRRGGALYVTRVSRRSITALYDLRYQLLKLTLWLAAVAGATGLWLGWSVVSPLLRVQRGVRAGLQNPADLDPADLALRRTDEIGELSRDFQRLTSALKDRVESTSLVAADLAHDLKGPIATVVATAELLGDGKMLDADRQRRLADALGVASEHMHRSVDGMLNLARVDRDLCSEPRVSLDLGSLIGALVERHRVSPATSALVLESHLEPVVMVLGSEAQLGRLVSNLIDNAAVFARSRVQVALRREAGEAVLTVSDDGPGISPGNRERLFQRFFSSRPPGVTPGTGLGLSIARTIARAHGGDLCLGDDGPLPGATLVVTLPLDPAG